VTGGRKVFESAPVELVVPTTIGGKKMPAWPVLVEATVPVLEVAEFVSDEAAVVVGDCVDGPTILVSVTICTGAVTVSTPALAGADVVGLRMLASCDAKTDAAGKLSLLVVVLLVEKGIDAVVVTVTVTVAAVVAGAAACGMTKFGAKFTAAG
jgi:hypothetical protein